MTLDRVFPGDLPSSQSPIPEPDLQQRPIDFGILAEHIGFLVHRAALIMRRDFLACVGDRQIRPAAFNTLALVGANPGLTQSELASALIVDKGTMAHLVRELQTVGWLESVSCAHDRRLKAVFLTPNGVRVLEQLKVEMQKCTQHIDAVLSPAERLQLVKLLGRIVAAGRTEVEEQPGSD